MASTYQPNKTVKTRKGRDYDQQILSADDYAALQGYRQDWYNATDDAGRQAAHQAAEDLRARYGYSMGADGGTFSLLDPMTGVSEHTNTGLLGLQSGPAQDWQNQLQDLLTQYQNRESFSYDPETDPTYQAMARMYQSQGRTAMDDTMAQAAGLTGGYGSSYAQSVGYQAYQNSLDQLAAQLPQLYQLALQSYQTQGENLMNQAQLLHQGYQQELDRYNAQQNYWLSLAQMEHSGYWNGAELSHQIAQDQYDASQDSAHAATQAQQIAWQQAMDSIALGVVPSAEVLAAAGISTAWAYAMAMSALYR